MTLIFEMPFLMIAGRCIIAMYVRKTQPPTAQTRKSSDNDDAVSDISSKTGNGHVLGNGHALRAPDEVSINSVRSAPASTVHGTNNNNTVEPAIMPGLRVITSQTSTTSLV